MKTNADANELAGALTAQGDEDPVSIPQQAAGKGSPQTSVGLYTLPRELVLRDQVEKLGKGRYHNFDSKWPKAFVSNKWTSSFKPGN